MDSLEHPDRHPLLDDQGGSREKKIRAHPRRGRPPTPLVSLALIAKEYIDSLDTGRPLVVVAERRG